MRQGQIGRDDIVKRQPRASMTFAHKSVTWHVMRIKKYATLNAMADIGQQAMTVDRGGISHDDAYVVEQGSLVDKLRIRAQLRMCSGYGIGK